MTDEFAMQADGARPGFRGAGFIIAGWRALARRSTRAGRRAADVRGAFVRVAAAAVWLAAVVWLGAGCARPAEPLVLASTTSTEDSGLFDVLLPAFAAAHPEYQVRLVAVGSGQALELGTRGDADVLLVHSPAAERAFMAAGNGVSRQPVMYNDFVIVGPAADPAGVRGASAAEALRRIAAAGAVFVTRGDDSGTHRKELALWEAAGVQPTAEQYLDVGQGMGETLAIARERQAYTLSDRGTFLFLRQRGGLEVLVEGDSVLFNPYSVIVARRARNPEGARAFAEWIRSPAAQRLIGEHGRARFGQPLFVPQAGNER